MNPHASTKCAGRLLMALAAISSIVLMAACGSSSNGPATNQEGFNDTSLNGTYVFSSSGVDSNIGAPIALAGAFATDGKGGIKGGTMDAVDPAIAVDTNETITGGSYKVDSDGRGQVTLVTGAGNFTLDFVLTSSLHGLVTEFDGNGTGSGTLDMQTAVTQSQLAGSYAFALGGFDNSLGNPLAAVGAFTLDSGGSVNPGVEDINDNGSLIPDLSVSGGVVTLGSGTGPGTITFSSSSQIFDFYPIDAAHWKVIETDEGLYSLSGDVFSQPGTSLPTGSMVFTIAGGAFSTIAGAGVMTYNGTTFSGSENFNDGQIINENFSSTAVLTGPVGGRTVVSLSSFLPANTWVVYPSSAGLLIMEADIAPVSTTVTLGAALTQTPGQSIAASQNYGFNLSAWNTSGVFEENDIAQFLTTTSSTFGGVVDINDDAGSGHLSQTSQTLAATYTLNADGTGTAATTANGGAYISFNFYPMSDSTLLVLETDSIQIGVGVIELQSTPSGSVPQSRISLAHPAVLRPSVRSRLAARRK